MKRLKIFLGSVGFSRKHHPLVTPPLGLMCLAAYLRRKIKADFQIVNQKLDNCSNEELVKKAAGFDADIVGLSAITPSAKYLDVIVQGIRTKLPHTKIILGGPHVTAVGGDVLRTCQADMAVQGEGEYAFEMIVRMISEGGKPDDIPGIWYRNEDGAVLRAPGKMPLIDNLDDLPLPAYDLIDLPAYWRKQSMPPVPRRRYASLFSSRGCPYGCIFCLRVFGRQYRTHSAERIIEEIRYVHKTYGINDFEFLDDSFNLDRERIFSFSDQLTKSGLKLKLAFPSGLRTDVLDPEVMDALIEAGMYFAACALESGSPEIQKSIGKNLNIEKFMENVVFMAQRHVFTYGFVMMGFPGETQRDMQATVDAVLGSRLHAVNITTATPFPNTPLYDMFKKMHPEMKWELDYEFLNGMTVNLSAVPDADIWRFRRRIYRGLFLDPRRIIRILRDFPNPHLLVLYLPGIIDRLSSGWSPLRYVIRRNTP